MQTTWQTLAAHQKAFCSNPAYTLNQLFEKNPNRFSELSCQWDDFLYDYSKQKLTPETLNLLFQMAKQVKLSEKIQDLFSGKNVNLTENQPALHTALRDFSPQQKPEITACLEQIKHFVEKIQSQNAITDLISLGIGGSALGSNLVCSALSDQKQTSLRLHFISNIDEHTLIKTLETLNPNKTLCLITSKTFTTTETLLNAQLVKQWLNQKTDHLIGITAHPKKAQAFGILPDHIFPFWSWVGGRYSIWSAVGLPVALSIGFSNFQAFLKGAQTLDQHFKQTPFENNIPVLMGLIDFWNTTFLNTPTLAIMPYCDRLEKLPAYLQQLIMESNGKSVNLAGQSIDYPTAPVVWGGVGCDGQHSFMQLLHQGNLTIPVDFILPLHKPASDSNAQNTLIANCLAQSQALMIGQNPSNPHQKCPGNRPSNTLLMRQLTPHTLGALLALYEHRTYVQSVLWNINAFDQFGVELGKQLARNLLPFIREPNTNRDALDSSTRGLLDFLKS